MEPVLEVDQDQGPPQRTEDLPSMFGQDAVLLS